jgi:hypothetical protein
MNISNLSSVTGSLPPLALPTPNQPESPADGTGSAPHATHHHHHRGPRVADPADASTVPGQDADQDDSQRVANLANKVNARLQHAISSGKFTSDQAVALKDAAAKFQDLMTRIGNAGDSGTTKRAVHFALHELGQQIQSVFAAQDASTSGSDIAAAITAPPVDTVA